MALRLNLDEMPRLLTASHDGLTPVGGADDTQIFVLFHQIFVAIGIDNLQRPCAWLGALHHCQVAGIKVFARIDILQVHSAVACILHDPLLGRHIGLGPHHNGGFFGQRGIGYHQRFLCIGSWNDTVCLASSHFGSHFLAQQEYQQASND